MKRHWSLSLFLLAIFLGSCAGDAATPALPIVEPTAALPALPAYPSPEDPVSSEPPADAPTTNQPWQPLPEDASSQRGMVFIEKKDLLTLESNPPQYVLVLAGSLPTPCHQLRIQVPEVDGKGRLMVDAYSIYKPGEVCIQVLEPFEVRVPLGSFAEQKVSILLNGELLGETSP